MKKYNRTAALLTAGLVLLTGCGLLPEEESLPVSPTYKAYEVPKYETAEVTRGDLADTGKVFVNYQPLQTESLFFRTAGLEVEAVYVKLGDQVKAGDVLLQLELGSLADNLESARLDKEKQEMSLRQLGEREDQEIKRARINYAEKPDSLEETLETIAARYEKQRQSLQDSLTILELKLAEYEEKVRDRQLIAGMDGTVSYLRNLAPGEKSNLNSQVITVTDSRYCLFRAETDLWTYMAEGDEFALTLDGIEYTLTVVDAADYGLETPEREEGKKSKVYLRLKEAAEMKSGTTGSIVVVKDSRKDVLLLPQAAITALDGKPAVCVLDDEGVKAYVPVETGLKAEDMIEICAGLTEGQTVILN